MEPTRYKTFKQFKEACDKLDWDTLYSKAGIYLSLGINYTTANNWKNKEKHKNKYDHLQFIFSLLEEKLVRLALDNTNNSSFTQFYLKNAYSNKYKDTFHNKNENAEIKVVLPD